MSNPKTIKINIWDMRTIRSFCAETNKVLDEKKLTVDGRLIYENKGRIYYVDSDNDIWKEHYSNNGESTNYGVSNYVNHYKFRG